MIEFLKLGLMAIGAYNVVKWGHKIWSESEVEIQKKMSENLDSTTENTSEISSDQPTDASQDDPAKDHRRYNNRVGLNLSSN